MPTEKRKILVIENQQYQFDPIVDYLKDYDVFPKKAKDYSTFIDCVRVWVNEQYEKDYRDIALANIREKINENKIELILMDHLLGGAQHCHTGIDLAIEINKVEKPELPIAFLSQVEHTEKRRSEAYEKYKKDHKLSKWIHKGYFGDEILKEDYFKSRVIPEIENLLGHTEEQRFWEDYDAVLGFKYSSNQESKKEKLMQIKNSKKYQSISENFKKMISSVAKSKNINEIQIYDECNL